MGPPVLCAPLSPPPSPFPRATKPRIGGRPTREWAGSKPSRVLLTTTAFGGRPSSCSTACRSTWSVATIVDKLSEFAVGFGPFVFSSLLSLVALFVPSRRFESAGKVYVVSKTEESYFDQVDQVRSVWKQGEMRTESPFSRACLGSTSWFS